jgi:hypothetical protein
MRKRQSARVRGIPTLLALLGALLLSSGFAVMVAAGGATASQGDDHKQAVCHPVNGKGELKNGWNLIPPDKASSHIDEANGNAPKHTSKDGRHDTLATPDGEGGWTCPSQDEEQPGLATAGVSKADPSCEDTDGSWTVVDLSHATSDDGASGNGVPNGTVTVHFTADDGYEFGDGNGKTSVTVSFGPLVVPEGLELQDGVCVAVSPPGGGTVSPPAGETPRKKAAETTAGTVTTPTVVHAGLSGPAGPFSP